jgi:hypothetical protein
MRQSVGNIGFVLMGDVELGELFNSLIPRVQDNIVKAGYKKGGKLILDQALSNFKQRFNDAGKMNFKQYFKNLPLKSKVGEKIGATGDKAYILRFLEYGTNERQYKTRNSGNHFTGKLKSSQFFSDAVEAKGAEAMNEVQKGIIESMEKTVAKYSKM